MKPNSTHIQSATLCLSIFLSSCTQGDDIITHSEVASPTIPKEVKANTPIEPVEMIMWDTAKEYIDKTRNNQPYIIDGLNLSLPTIQEPGRKPEIYRKTHDTIYFLTNNYIYPEHKKAVKLVYTAKWREFTIESKKMWTYTPLEVALYDDGSGPRFTFEPNGDYWLLTPVTP